MVFYGGCISGCKVTSYQCTVIINPCPCGYYGDSEIPCECSLPQIKKYTRKLSGPLLDRFDIQIRVPRVSYQEITSEVRAEKSSVIRQRVVAARKIQLDRFRELDIVCNAQMNHGILKKYCQLTDEAQELMETAFQERNLSARSYDRIVKVAQTVADLSGSDIISEIHIGEALQLRGEILPGNNF